MMMMIMIVMTVIIILMRSITYMHTNSNINDIDNINDVNSWGGARPRRLGPKPDPDRGALRPHRAADRGRAEE